MLNNTPSYSNLIAAQKAWLAIFNNPSATQSAKDAAKAAYKEAFMKCRSESGIVGRGRARQAAARR